MSSKSLIRSRWAAIGAAVAVTLGGGGLIGVSAASGDASSLKTVTPTRIMDTRQGTDGKVSGETVALQVTGEITTYASNGTTPAATVVPAGANAVSLNLTVTQGERNQGYGFVTAFPCTAVTDTVPNASTLNFVEGVDVANSTVVPLGATGKICLNVYGSAHLIIDANGYYETVSAGAVDAYTKAESDATEADINAAIDLKADVGASYTKEETDRQYFQGGRVRTTQINAWDWQLGTSFCAGGGTCELTNPDGGRPYFVMDNGTGITAEAQFYIPLTNESDSAYDSDNQYDFYYGDLCMSDPSGDNFLAPELDSVTLYYDDYDSTTAKYTRASVGLDISGGTGTAPGVTSDDDSVTCFGLLPSADYEPDGNRQNFALSVKLSDNGNATTENRLLLHGGYALWYNAELYAELG